MGEPGHAAAEGEEGQRGVVGQVEPGSECRQGKIDIGLVAGEIYGRIARTGQPERFVAQAKQFGRWYDVYAFRVDDAVLNHVAVLFNDVTRRVQTEEKLRQAAALDAYRVSLSDALRPLTDPAGIQAVAARILGEHLNASRTVYAEVRSGEDSDYYIVLQHYHAPDTSSLTGTYRANDFGGSLFEEMRAGRTLVVCDVSQDSRLSPEEKDAYPRLDVAAYIHEDIAR